MESLLHWGLSNAATAALLAVAATIATRIWKNPHFAYAVWLIVLLRLIAPPLVPLTIPIPDQLAAQLTTLLAPSPIPRGGPRALLSPSPSLLDFGELSRAGEGRTSASSVESGEGLLSHRKTDYTATPTTILVQPTIANRTTVPAVAQTVAPSAEGPPESASGRRLSVAQALTALWIAGSLLYVAIVGLRAAASPAACDERPATRPKRIQTQASEIAATIGLRRTPRLAVIEGPLPPMVWSGLRPVVLLPRSAGRVDRRVPAAALTAARAVARSPP